MKASEFKKEMKRIREKAPRAGVHHTKIVKDKTKYSRKRKHAGAKEQKDG
jgi:hypothetical protein